MTMPFDALTQIPDEALLVLYANGDRAAAGALTHRMAPRLMAQAFRILKDRAEAEDVTQEAMLRLWKIAPRWRTGEAQVSSWLFRVVANLCTDRLRKTRTVDIDAVAEPFDDTPGAEQVLQTAARARALDAALAALPDRQKEAVILRHIDGLTNPEIAQVMDIGIEAVESLTARGKRGLAGMLRAQKDALGL
ncbi:MAG: RNA polymerase sigma-70 factor (ECF subfamily) [Paracoccaceae bacterium]|jgi:RNA polymerase sigma-70 factor (ECF subfamily)